jgi:NADPH-dependent 2,4-dienoyl-CoA reductase/sulfur reductase-like enzyme
MWRCVLDRRSRFFTAERPLERFDPDLVDEVVKRTQELGVDVQLGTEAQRIEKDSGRFMVVASASGQKREISGGHAGPCCGSRA